MNTASDDHRVRETASSGLPRGARRLMLIGASTSLFLILIGLTGTLFGWPFHSWIPSTTGFILPLIMISAFSNGRNLPPTEVGTEVAFSAAATPFHPRRCATSFRRAIIILVGLFVVGQALRWMVAANRGVTHNDVPLFAAQTEYVLNSHGKKTVVDRKTYVLTGLTFDVPSHAGAAIPALAILCYALCGRWPFRFYDESNLKC